MFSKKEAAETWDSRHLFLLVRACLTKAVVGVVTACWASWSSRLNSHISMGSILNLLEECINTLFKTNLVFFIRQELRFLKRIWINKSENWKSKKGKCSAHFIPREINILCAKFGLNHWYIKKSQNNYETLSPSIYITEWILSFAHEYIFSKIL